MEDNEVKKSKKSILSIVLAGIIPVGTLCFVEYYTHVPSDLTVPIFLTNLLVYYLFYLFCSFLTGRTNTGFMAATILLGLFGAVNYVVMNFRSAPVVPWDIYSVKTAVSVAENYKFSPDSHFIVSMIGLCCIVILSSMIRIRVRRIAVRSVGAVLVLVMMLCYTKAVGSTAVIDAVGLDTILFTPKVLYRNNGLVTGFLGVMKYLKVDRPEDYSLKNIEKITEAYKEETDVPEEELPNVIVIMNEAFSDMNVYGDFEVSQDYMPFIHSLEENSLQGNCYVSVKGGNTANSEYEFLTGNSMKFVPAGSVPYQQYVKSEIPSLAWNLKDLGYRTVAIHPYNAGGWKRDQVYPLLGFEEMYFKNDFEEPETLRGYIDDRSAFQKIIDLYEAKDTGEPLFAFEVTMQNHGGYSKEYSDLSAEIELTGLQKKNTQTIAAEKYLTLIEKTDEAFQEMVEYFSGQKEKTVILMFGDHQPSDYITNTFVRLQGMDPSDPDMIQKGYVVPYIMWANFELNETGEKNLSMNYLSTSLMSRSGLPLTGYQRYLQDLQSEVPVITVNGTFDQNGVRMDADKKLVGDYSCLAYNLLCDDNKKDWLFFEPLKKDSSS